MNYRVCDLLSEAERQLVISDSARLDSEILLSHVMNVPRETFYAHPENIVSDNIIADFQSLILKRTSGFPIAYLLGQKEFWSIMLTVNQSTLIPRPETECLVETALELITCNSDFNILDLGTGSGAIAISIARERPLCHITATDIVSDSLNIAQANAIEYQVRNISFRESDWFNGLSGEVFDYILCNPPYVDTNYSGFSESEIRFEPRIALDGGYLGIEVINHIIPAAAAHLKPGGYLILEHGFDQSVSINELLVINNFVEVCTRKDYTGKDRITYARKT